MARLTTTLLASALGMLIAATPLRAQAVDLELALLVDVSGSVDNAEYALQKTGYVNAFTNPALWTAISEGVIGRIAVTYVEWSSSGVQDQLVGWTLVDSQAAATAFAAAIAGTSRASFGSTAIGSALQYGGGLFGANAYDGTRQVIDVSGDGCNNDGISADAGRTSAVGAGVDAINGLVINPAGETCSFAGGFGDIQDFYESEVEYNGFVEVASGFDDFEAAVSRKLIREVAPPNTTVPEPMSVVLLGTGLAGLFAVRRRRQNRAG